MKIIKDFPILMLVCLFQTGCVHDDEYSGGYSDKSVQFTAHNIDTRTSSSGWHEANVSLGGDTATTSSPVTTRGSVVSGTDAPVGSFGVLGYILPNGTWSSSLLPTFMYKTQVIRRGNKGSYTFQYYPSKYWPTTGTDLVKFFAYYPYDGNGITLSPSSATGYPSIAYASSTTVSDQVDLMVASPSACNNQSDGSAVGLSFNHALTRISFSVKCSSYNMVTVQSVALTGINSKGTFSYDPSVASTPWTPSSLSTDTTTYKATTSDGTLIPESYQALSVYNYRNITSGTGTFLLLPQSVTSSNKLVVKYTVDGVAKVATINLHAATWAMGQSINYQLILGLDNSNCYVVNPSTVSDVTLNIPLTRVNEFWGNASYGNNPLYVIRANDTWTADIVWQDVPNLVTLSTSSGTGPTGNIVVRVPTKSTSGNAIIGIKKTGTSGYAWSWHVWVTGYNPNTTNSVINGYTFMNYDLGTTNLIPGQGYKGLYYQWGRKDPFPQVSAVASNTVESIYGTYTSITNTAVAVANNLANAVENPATFYHGSDWGWSNWYTNNSSLANNNALWGIVKTIYDPCPQGWKIMPIVACSASFTSTTSSGPMTYSGSNYGWTHTESGTFWPISGYFLGSCTPRFVGTMGYIWSSTCDTTISVLTNPVFYLSIANGYIETSTLTLRDIGCHVRCVRDN